MSTLPTPIRAALGLAATALDEARKLPETLPQVPVVAVTTAMQASLRVQQHIAALAARGDELLSQLRGTTAEAPAWATFDEDEAPASDGRSAAFDRAEHPDSASEASATELFPASEVGGTEPDAEPAGSTATMAEPAVSATPPSGPKKASAVKATPAKASGTAKTSAAKTNPTKAKAKPVKRSEPLVEAAKHAKPSATPNPSTMAAEIVQAHEAETQSAPGETE
jgi:hypothetical protein